MSQRRGRRGSVLGFYWLWSSDWDEVGGLKTRCCSSFSAVISVLAASKGLLSHSSNPHFPFVTRSTCSPVSDYQSDTYSRLDTHLLFISFRFHPFFFLLSRRCQIVSCCQGGFSSGCICLFDCKQHNERLCTDG